MAWERFRLCASWGQRFTLDEHDFRFTTHPPVYAPAAKWDGGHNAINVNRGNAAHRLRDTVLRNVQISPKAVRRGSDPLMTAHL
jgi:hypothetical protein